MRLIQIISERIEDRQPFNFNNRISDPLASRGQSINAGNDIGGGMTGDANEFATMHPKQLLDTPEELWIPALPPERMREMVARFPEHGPNEACAKLTKILTYGPDHEQASSALGLIAKHWPISGDDLIQRIGEYGEAYDQEQAREFIEKYGHSYGIR